MSQPASTDERVAAIVQAVREALPRGLTESELQQRMPFVTPDRLDDAIQHALEDNLIEQASGMYYFPLNDTSRGNPALAALLHQQADMLRAAADKVSRLAERAATGNVGSTEQGFGYHFLADQSLHAVITVLANMTAGRAFQAAADADIRSAR